MWSGFGFGFRFGKRSRYSRSLGSPRILSKINHSSPTNNPAHSGANARMNLPDTDVPVNYARIKAELEQKEMEKKK